MQNQPTGRPWFRQLSQPRMDLMPQPAQPPAPAPAPTPPFRRPTFSLLRQTDAESQAQPQTLPPQPQLTQPPPPQPQPPAPSPPQPQLLTPQPPTQPQPFPPPSNSTNGVIEPQQPLKPLVMSPQLPSPRSINAPSPRSIYAPPSVTPPPSPRVIKATNPTPPPSPKANQMQTLPPSQPKSIIVQEEDIKGSSNGQSQSEVRVPPPAKSEDKNAGTDRRVPTKAATWKKDESEMSVVTMAGENMGAYMELGTPHSHHQHQQHHNMKQHDGRPHNQRQGNEPMRDEGKSGDKDVKATKVATKTKPLASLVNSNVQSVNNSIIFNTSCTTRSPGVHITLARHRAPRAPIPPPSKGGVHLSKGTPAANHDH